MLDYGKTDACILNLKANACVRFCNGNRYRNDAELLRGLRYYGSLYYE